MLKSSYVCYVYGKAKLLKLYSLLFCLSYAGMGIAMSISVDNMLTDSAKKKHVRLRDSNGKTCSINTDLLNYCQVLNTCFAKDGNWKEFQTTVVELSDISNLDFFVTCLKFEGQLNNDNRQESDSYKQELEVLLSIQDFNYLYTMVILADRFSLLRLFDIAIPALAKCTVKPSDKPHVLLADKYQTYFHNICMLSDVIKNKMRDVIMHEYPDTISQYYTKAINETFAAIYAKYYNPNVRVFFMPREQSLLVQYLKQDNHYSTTSYYVSGLIDLRYFSLEEFVYLFSSHGSFAGWAYATHTHGPIGKALIIKVQENLYKKLASLQTALLPTKIIFDEQQQVFTS